MHALPGTNHNDRLYQTNQELPAMVYSKCYALIVSKLLFFLICGPNLNNTQGIGNIVSDKNPSRLVAQAIPILSYTSSVESADLPFRKRSGDTRLTLDSEERKGGSCYIPDQTIGR